MVKHTPLWKSPQGQLFLWPKMVLGLGMNWSFKIYMSFLNPIPTRLCHGDKGYPWLVGIGLRASKTKIQCCIIFDQLIFHYFLQLMSVRLAWKSATKSSETLVNQKYAILFLSWTPFNFRIFFSFGDVFLKKLPMWDSKRTNEQPTRWRTHLSKMNDYISKLVQTCPNLFEFVQICWILRLRIMIPQLIF